ncbi:MAG TPA: hypothetical protein VMW54_00945 [Terriglobia bacterium]|nr:hypothetical protein [Terriglobia bacterium]
MQETRTSSLHAAATRNLLSLWARCPRRAVLIQYQGGRWGHRPYRTAHRAALHPRFYGFYQRQGKRHGTSRAAVALTRKLAAIAFYRWRHALQVAATLPQVEKPRERTSSSAWSEHRPFSSD